MTKDQIRTFTCLALFLAAGLWVLSAALNFILPPTTAEAYSGYQLLRYAAYLILGFGLVGIYILEYPALGNMGLLAFCLSLSGVILMTTVLGAQAFVEFYRLLGFSGPVVLPIGLVIFALAIRRNRRPGSRGMLVLALGAVLYAMFLLVGVPSSAQLTVSSLVMAAGAVDISLALRD